MSSLPVDYLEASLNLTGGLLSILGAGFIIICYIILPTKKHIRHAFILNLTIADFINAVNNSVSGLIVLATNKHLVESPSCTANGFLGQLSVQAVDCSILAITVVTWWTITSQKTSAELPSIHIIIICSCVWVLPFTTSLIALFKGYYEPVSTSWCWITADPTYLRYVLTHGWRFLIIFIVGGLCIYIQIYLRKHMLLAVHQATREATQDTTEVIPLDEIAQKSFSKQISNDSQDYDEEMMSRVQTRDDGQITDPRSALPTTSPLTKFALPVKKARSPKVKAAEKRARAVQKTMLLNAYPILYIILWLPGIANRIAEASGNPSYILRILQSATQFIGLANAITFGWNERIGQHLKARFIAKYKGANRKRWTID